MKTTLMGAASIAIIALAGCAKKEDTNAAETAAAESVAIETPETIAADAAAEAADVYAATDAVDLTSVRTKEALNAASDVAFAQADGDADGALSQTEFYSLAAILTPETPADAAIDALEPEIAPESVGEAAEAIVDDDFAEEPAAGTAALDARYAAIAGADGALTADDLRAALQARFDAADANLDGALDEAESAAFSAGNLI